MPFLNLLRKFFTKILIWLFLSFILYQWAKWFFPENEMAKKYIAQYEQFLSFSWNLISDKIPWIWDYLKNSEKQKQQNAYDELVNWEWDILDKMWNAFSAMDKYVMIQKWILIMQNPDLAKEFSTTWAWDIMKSVEAMKNYRKMQDEVYWEMWISDDESYMNFQEIQQYWKIIEWINKWEKTEQDLIYFLENLSKKSKETEILTKNLKQNLIKIWKYEIKKNWWNLEKTFENVINENFSDKINEDFINAE